MPTSFGGRRIYTSWGVTLFRPTCAEQPSLKNVLWREGTLSRTICWRAPSRRWKSGSLSRLEPCKLSNRSAVTGNHKELTYVEYRAVSGVFQNVDPPPPLHPASVSSPRTKRGIHTRRAVRGWGVNILEDARHRIGLLQYNLSTPAAGNHLTQNI
jgi:hypothetical protein